MNPTAWKEKYKEYATKHSIPQMPDRGYGISGYLDRLAGHYTSYFISKSHAIKAAQYLANATRENVDLMIKNLTAYRNFIRLALWAA